MITRQSKKYTKKAAFTLIELIVALAIIMVIAALIIPSLILNINENEYDAGLKTAFSTLSQAFTNLQAEELPVHIGTAAAVADPTLLRTDICNALSCIKQDIGDNIVGSLNYYNYKSSTLSPSFSSSDSAAVLNNGSYMQFNSLNNCTTVSGTLGNICGSVSVDINGSKGPKMWGKDLFMFHIVRNNGTYSILPFGFSGDGNACVPNDPSLSSSYGCTYARLTTPDSMP